MARTCPSWLALALASAHSFKWANWVTRVIFAGLMAIAFSIIIYLGPLALVLLILLVQVKCFSEVTSIGHKHYAPHPITQHKVKTRLLLVAEKPKEPKSNTTLALRRFGIQSWTWYLLVTSNYFFLTEFLSSYTYSGASTTTQFTKTSSTTFIASSNSQLFRNPADPDLPGLAERVLSLFLEYHRIISFALYIVAILWFVILDNSLNSVSEDTNKNKAVDYDERLRMGTKQFFSIFAFTHVALLILVAPSYLIIQNLSHGLIWFIVPVSMVNWNDAMAYLCGTCWGRRPLIQVSPKKTWEGFVGGGILTVIFGAALSYILCQYPYLLCPLPVYEISPTVNCTVASLFTAQDYHVDVPLLEGLTFSLIPFVLHSFVLSFFASVVGPFGGFFASGFKRAFQIKDFGHVIPGHGGVLDRFDCQFLMATFVNVYITTFIAEPKAQVQSLLSLSTAADDILHQALTLDSPEQIKFINSLQQHLTQRGLL